MQPLVSAIIVNWNGKQFLDDCISSLLKQTYKNCEIILVDNASTDGSVSYVRKKYPRVRIIKNNKNVGFGNAVNIGIKHAKGYYIIFLNNDLYIEKNCIKNLLKPLENEVKVATVPKVLFFQERNKINSYGNIVNFLGFAMPKYINQDERVASREEETACGGLLMVRKEVIEKVGLFDENFFLYHEDHDLSWRLRLYGYKLLVVPGAKVYHKYTFSRTFDKFYHSEKNRLQLLLKNYSLKTILLLSPAIAFIEVAEIMHSIMNGWYNKKLSSYFEIYRNLPNLLKKRVVVQRNRKINDSEIVRLFVGYIKFEYINSIFLERLISPILNFYWHLVRRLI